MTLQYHSDGVVAVVVVYERNLERVRCWAELLSLLNLSDSNELRLKHILVYDNSATPQAEPFLISNCSYIHNPKNGGTSAAYTYALKLAQDLKLGWLLLLDHDTEIPKKFFDSASIALAASIVRPAALLPWVVDGERSVSPACITWMGSIKPIIRKNKVFQCRNLTGIASASFVDSTSLKMIGPLPASLWLDYVDHWIFLNFNKLDKKIVIFNAVVQHELSVFQRSAVSRERLFSILDGELVFVNSFSWHIRFIYSFRLGFRLVRNMLFHPGSALDMFAWMIAKLSRSS